MEALSREYDIANSAFRLEDSLQGDFINVKWQKGKMSFVSHWHDAVEILLGVSNSVAVGLSGQYYELKKDEIILIGPRESHFISDISLESQRIALLFEAPLVFGNKLLSPYWDIFSLVEHHSSTWPADVTAKMRELLVRVCREYNAKVPGWEAAVLARLMEIVELVISRVPKRDVSCPSRGDSVTLKIIQYLSERYQEDVSLESCAQALGFNNSYLSAKFKSQVGITFHQYLNNLRLNHAERLLRDGDLPVSLVAEKAGFSSPKTFYRVFHEKNGISPKQYRFQWKKRV